MKNKTQLILLIFSLAFINILSSCSDDDSVTSPEPIPEPVPEVIIPTPVDPTPPEPSGPEIPLLIAPETIAPIVSDTANRAVLSWDGNPTTFQRSLIQAVNDAGTNGIVEIPDGTYRSDRVVSLPNIEGVTFIGSSRDNVIIEMTQVIRTSGLLIVQANNTRFINMTLDWGSAVGNVACAINTNGFSNIEAHGMRFKNANIGIGSPDNRTGRPFDFMTVSNCIFEDCTRGIFFNRNFSEVQVRKIGKVTVRNCQFTGVQRLGISIDCGNDGADGAEQFRDLPFAEEAVGVVTDMDGMEISGCTFEEVELFNIAIAKASNIKIFGNTILGTGDTQFTECINMEHESNAIEINNNNISNNAPNSSSYISILTFRDHGNLPLFENGCKNIIIANNRFSGNSRNGITGEEGDNIRILDNEFNTPLPSGTRNINFFSSPTGSGNRDIDVQRNTNTPENRIGITPFRG